MSSVASIDVPLSIEKFHKGEMSMYLQLTSIFSDPNLSDTQLIQLINDLARSAEMLNRKCSSLLTKVKNLDWRKISCEAVVAHSNFLIALVHADLCHLEPIFGVLIKKCLPEVINPEITVDEFDKQFGKTYDQIYRQVHKTLSALFDSVPIDDKVLVNLLHSFYPFFRRHTVQIRDYNRNLLSISDYLPHLRHEIWGLVIEELSKLDTMYGREIPKSVLIEQYGLFEMDVEKMTNGIDQEQQEQFSKKLDCCLADLFIRLQKFCFDKEEKLIQKRANGAYATLRFLFNGTILPLRGSASVPFLWFYICSISQNFARDFLKVLWSIVVNPKLESPFRCNAACYLASFVARAKFINIDTVIESLVIWVKWLNDYVKSQDGVTPKSACVHAVFYAMCTAAFYVIAFRCKEFTTSKEGVRKLKSLKLRRLVCSPLNPLNFCNEKVLSAFVNFVRNHNIAHCHDVVQRNSRTETLVGQEDYGFHFFFPFDPCQLNKCSAFVSAIYNDFTDGHIASAEEGLVDAEDNATDCQLSPSPLKKKFKYSSSPGFKQYVGQK